VGVAVLRTLREGLRIISFADDAGIASNSRWRRSGSGHSSDRADHLLNGESPMNEHEVFKKAFCRTLSPFLLRDTWQTPGSFCVLYGDDADRLRAAGKVEVIHVHEEEQ